MAPRRPPDDRTASARDPGAKAFSAEASAAKASAAKATGAKIPIAKVPVVKTPVIKPAPARPVVAKPPDGPADRVDARLIAIATEHLRLLGPGKVTVVAVAQAAGMTHANVYRYFPSKEALIDAVVGEALKPIEAVIADVASAPDPADDKLERLVLDLARVYRSLMERNAPVFRLFVTATQENRAVARRHRGRIRLLVERVVDEGITTGAFEPRDREGALSFLTDVLYRFTHPSAVVADAGVPRDVLDRRLAGVVRVALRALSVGLI